MKFHKNLSSGSRVVPCGRRIRGRFEAKSGFPQLCERA